MKDKFKIGDFITTYGINELCSEVLEIVDDRHGLDWVCKDSKGRVAWIMKSSHNVWRLATKEEQEVGHRKFVPYKDRFTTIITT